MGRKISRRCEVVQHVCTTITLMVISVVISDESMRCCKALPPHGYTLCLRHWPIPTPTHFCCKALPPHGYALSEAWLDRFRLDRFFDFLSKPIVLPGRPGMTYA